MTKLIAKHVDAFVFDVMFDNGAVLGRMVKEVDGYYYFEATEVPGVWSSWQLRQIASLLDANNAEWDHTVRAELSEKGSRHDGQENAAEEEVPRDWQAQEVLK